jgi:glycosyltransferase involved in cell wall biosynthesis
MAKRGHQVTIFTAGNHSTRTQEPGIKTVKFRRRFSQPGRHERWFGSMLVPQLLKGRFDAVHSMMAYDALAAVRTRRLAGHRAVYEELGSPFKSYWSTLEDGAVRARLVREVDVYGCMSNFSLDVLRQEWGREGALIPGGVRLSEFVADTPRQVHPTILMAGALTEPRKGLGDLLAAAEILIDTRPDLQIWLSGPGDPAMMLAAATPRVRERVTVLPIGDPHELSHQYAGAWVTTLPSIGDSFGMVLIESLASGTPIVVANDGAPPQLVTERTGTVGEPHDPPSLSDALERGLALSQRPETAAHCRDFAAQFDWDAALAPLLESLYEGD